MSETKSKVAVVGLGNMGLGMALSLQRGGFDVVGFDSSAAAGFKAAEVGLAVTNTMSDAVRGANAVVLSLPTSAIVEKVLLDHGSLLSLLQQGAVVIDTSTAEPDSSRKLAKAATERGIVFIDAPVSGGPTGARNGELTMFLGGTANDIASATPFLEAMGTKRFHIGDTGAGNIAKIVNNLLTAAQLITAGEAFRMAEKAGVKTEQLIEAVNAGSGRSGVTLFNYPNRILNGGFNSGFTMQLMRKDVRLAMTLIEKLEVPSPIMREVGSLWKASEEQLVDTDDFNRIVNFVR
jgi:3-hydroxyisobutyrate dehydrogenase